MDVGKVGKGSFLGVELFGGVQLFGRESWMVVLVGDKIGVQGKSLIFSLKWTTCCKDKPRWTC